MAKVKKDKKAPEAEVETKGKKNKGGDKTEKGAAKADKKEKSTEEKLPYGVAELADALELKEASVRVKLRNSSVPKNGKSYGWKTKAEFTEVLNQLKAEAKAEAKGEKKPKKDKGEPAAEEKTEKKSKKDKKSKKGD